MRLISCDKPIAVLLCSMAVGGCGLFDREQQERAPASSAPAPVASASAPTPPAKASMDVVGTGVGPGTAVNDVEGCNPHASDIATYLKRGELTLAARGEEIAAAWLVQLRGAAQIGFGGFNTKGEQIARDRGIGSAREHPPRIFATGTAWTVAWFDPEGLAYARPTWEPHPPPDIDHLDALKSVAPENVGFAVEPDGTLIAASPFGTSGNQLSVFSFAPLDDPSKPVKAVGVTKFAKQPKHPVVTADGSGYTLAWHEPGGVVMSTRLTTTGKEMNDQAFVVVEGEAGPSGPDDRIGLVSTGAGSLAIWQRETSILARGLDGEGRPNTPIWRVGTGKWARLVPAGERPLALWVGIDGEDSGQVIAARFATSGPPTASIRLTAPPTEVMDSPDAAATAEVLAVAWTEQMSPSIKSKRARLKTIDVSCVR